MAVVRLHLYPYNPLILPHEPRQRAVLPRLGYPLLVLLHPVLELLGRLLHLVHAVAIHRLAVENPLRVRIHLLLGLEDGGGVAPAMGMPPRELEVLRVLPLQLVADVLEAVRLAVTPLAGVVAREVYLYPHHEVQVLPPLVVGGAVRHVRLGDGEPPRVLVRGAIDALPGMEGCGVLREVEDAALVPHPAEEFVGVLEVLLQVPRRGCRGLAALDV